MVSKLRNIQKQDVKVLLQIRQDALLQDMLMGYPHAKTTKKAEEWLEYHISNKKDFFQTVADSKTNNCIGFIQLYDIHHLSRYAFLGMAIHSCFHNCGYGKSALDQVCQVAKNQLNLFKIILNVLKCNEHAIDMYSKMGFREVGYYEKQYSIDNKRLDVVIMEKIL